MKNMIPVPEAYAVSKRKAKVEPVPELDRIEKALWKFVIKNGGIGEDRGYYGGMQIDAYTKKYKDTINKINSVGIDWTQTRPITDDYCSVFAGTFAEQSDTEYYIKGTLVLLDGTEIFMIYKEYDKSNLASTMREIFRNIDLYKELIEDAFT